MNKCVIIKVVIVMLLSISMMVIPLFGTVHKYRHYESYASASIQNTKV